MRRGLGCVDTRRRTQLSRNDSEDVLELVPQQSGLPLPLARDDHHGSQCEVQELVESVVHPGEVRTRPPELRVPPLHVYVHHHPPVHHVHMSVYQREVGHRDVLPEDYSVPVRPVLSGTTDSGPRYRGGSGRRVDLGPNRTLSSVFGRFVERWTTDEVEGDRRSDPLGVHVHCRRFDSERVFFTPRRS